MKCGPVLTFVTDSLDKYTKVPTEPAVEGCPDTNTQTEATLAFLSPLKQTVFFIFYFLLILQHQLVQ